MWDAPPSKIREKSRGRDRGRWRSVVWTSTNKIFPLLFPSSYLPKTTLRSVSTLILILFHFIIVSTTRSNRGFLDGVIPNCLNLVSYLSPWPFLDANFFSSESRQERRQSFFSNVLARYRCILSNFWRLFSCDGNYQFLKRDDPLEAKMIPLVAAKGVLAYFNKVHFHSSYFYQYNTLLDGIAQSSLQSWLVGQRSEFFVPWVSSAL